MNLWMCECEWKYDWIWICEWLYEYVNLDVIKYECKCEWKCDWICICEWLYECVNEFVIEYECVNVKVIVGIVNVFMNVFFVRIFNVIVNVWM